MRCLSNAYFSIQLTANSILGGNGVVWVGRCLIRATPSVIWPLTPSDCFQELQVSRLEKVLASSNSGVPGVSADVELPASSPGKFTLFSCLTLPHFMALVSRPNAKAIPEGTALIVISNVSALINSSLPKRVDGKTGPKANKGWFQPLYV